MAKIYVSSTYLDLKEHREQVERVIRRMGHADVAMEYYVAEDARPVAKCLADVAACDVYVGIFAWRYGWQPKDDNPDQFSITEMEFHQAEKTGKPCLIFLLSDDAPWLRKHIDKDTTKIENLRNTASARHNPDYFTTPDELARKVAEAIYKRIPAAIPIPEHNLGAYYAALRKRYGVLALEGLTPPQKEEYLQIQLRSVFVEQNVRENPPPVELPKEVWEKLELDMEIHAEDLPSGISLSDMREVREAYYEKPSRPVLDVLTDARYQHATILGDPGSGKSTLARYVMLSLIDPTPTPALPRPFYERTGEGVLPLLIELRSYAGLCADDKCNSFLEFLEYLGKTEGWALTQSALHNHLKNDGRAVVIFDGLDEIFDPEQLERITRQIVGFAGDYPKARVIVTSRVIGYRRKILTDAGFTHFTLQDLDEKQVETFVSRWYDLAMSERPDEARERRERILRSFKESASIRQLAGNPMLLTIMAIIGKHQELPRERWKLYDHAASVLIQHWDVNKHLKDARIVADFIGEDDKKELLRRLAFRMQGGEGGLAGNYIHHDQLQAEFEDYLKTRYAQSPDRAAIIARAMIEQFRERNFILSLYGANLYGFVHRAFLEYFCASAFVYKFEKTKELTIEQLKTDVYGKHWEDQSWHEVLRLICGMIDEKWAISIIEYLQDEVDQDWSEELGGSSPWNLALACNCIRELRNFAVTTSVAQKMIERLFELFEDGMFYDIDLQDFVPQHVLPAVFEVPLPVFEEQNILEWIHRSGRIRPATWSEGSEEDLGKLIGHIANKSVAAKAILLHFVHQKSDLPRTWVWAIGYGWVHDAQTLQLLRNWAVNSEQRNVRMSAMDVLGEYFHDEAQTLPLLRDRVVNDNESFVRASVVNALAKYYREDMQTLPLLHDRAVNDTNELVRSSAVNALARYYREDMQTLPLLHDRAVNDTNERVRSSAVNALGEYFRGDVQTFPLLRNWAVNSQYPDIRLAAVRTLGEYFYEDVQTLPLLRDWAVSSQHSEVRSSAVRALGEYFREDPQTLPILRDHAVNDTAHNVRWAAVDTLGECFREDPQTLPILLERAVNDSAENVRSSAVRALGEYLREDARTLPLLRECALNDTVDNVRWTAVHTLGKYFREDAQTLPLLRERSQNDPSTWLRELAKDLADEIKSKTKE